MNRKMHWFPLYTDAYIVGTRALTFRQQGLYVQLLILQFESKSERITLRAACKTLNVPETDEDLTEVLAEKFEQDEDGYYNERMRQTTEEQKEKSRKRDASLQRARKSKALKAQKYRSSTEELRTDTECNTSAAQRTATGIELELEKELETELEVTGREICNAGKPRRVNKRAKQFMDSWNEVALSHNELSRIDTWSRKRQESFRKLTKAMGEERLAETWTRALAQLPIPNREAFKWQPTFDWCMKEGNLLKLAEGNYNNEQKQTKTDSEKRSERVSGFLDW
ncbi:MAG: DUF1376 domain-containing protein [Alphaproteobacteria bacterium]